LVRLSVIPRIVASDAAPVFRGPQREDLLIVQATDDGGGGARRKRAAYGRYEPSVMGQNGGKLGIRVCDVGRGFGSTCRAGR